MKKPENAEFGGGKDHPNATDIARVIWMFADFLLLMSWFAILLRFQFQRNRNGISRKTFVLLFLANILRYHDMFIDFPMADRVNRIVSQHLLADADIQQSFVRMFIGMVVLFDQQRIVYVYCMKWILLSCSGAMCMNSLVTSPVDPSKPQHARQDVMPTSPFLAVGASVGVVVAVVWFGHDIHTVVRHVSYFLEAYAVLPQLAMGMDDQPLSVKGWFLLRTLYSGIYVGFWAVNLVYGPNTTMPLPLVSLRFCQLAMFLIGAPALVRIAFTHKFKLAVVLAVFAALSAQIDIDHPESDGMKVYGQWLAVGTGLVVACLVLIGRYPLYISIALLFNVVSVCRSYMEV